jgi:hypothetical protein
MGRSQPGKVMKGYFLNRTGVTLLVRDGAPFFCPLQVEVRAEGLVARHHIRPERNLA